MLFHGVNMVEKQAPYYPAAFGFDGTDAAWLEANGLSLVRLGVLGTGLMPTPGRIDQPTWPTWPPPSATLGRHHVDVLLDLHQDGWGPSVGSDGFPGWMTLTHGATNNHAGFPDYYLTDPAIQAAFQSLWDNDKGPDGVGLQTDVAAMFGALAATFARTPNVVGYDVFNEPWPGTTWQPCLSAPEGCPSLVSTELDPLYRKVDAAIRRHDRTHLVLTEPFVLFNYRYGHHHRVPRPDDDPRSGLAFHQYALSTPGAASVLDQRAVLVHADRGRPPRHRVGGHPVGVDNPSRGPPSSTTHCVPWAFWSFDGETVKDLAAPTERRQPGGEHRRLGGPPAPPGGGRHPECPVLHTGSRVMTARWSTTEPDGKHPAPGTVSALAVPRLDYPAGYSVAVRGATVTSARCAPLLTVAAAPRSTDGLGHRHPGRDCPVATASGRAPG